MNNEKTDVRSEEELINAFEMADNIVFKNYIGRLEKLDIVEPREELMKIEVGEKVRLLKVEKIIYDPTENNLQKLTNLYNMAYSQNLDLVLLINSDGKKIELLIGICDNRNEEQIESRLKNGIESFYNCFVGNFPGSLGELEKLKMENEENKAIIDRCFAEKAAVSVVSGIASIRGEKEEKNENFIQGIEKLIDSMRGIDYSVMILANPVNTEELNELKNELESLYSSLKPFEKTVRSFSESHTDGISSSISKGFSDSYGSSKSKSLSLGTTKSTSHTKGHSVGASINVGGMLSTAISTGASLILGPLGGTIAKAVTKGLSGGGGVNASMQRSTTQTEGTTETETNTESTNEQHSETKTNTESSSASDTTGSTLQIEYINKSVKQLLDRIDMQLERLKKCESFGVYTIASYFCAKTKGYSNMAASIYKSLISGDNSSVESSHLSSWDDKESVDKIKSYLKRMHHPVFKLLAGTNENYVTAVSLVSGNELAIQAGLPKKSVPGVVVTDCAAFGRNLYMLTGDRNSKNIEIGNIYHMYNDEKAKVKLKVDDLSMHTFITGATGSGKSNAVYQLLQQLDNSGNEGIKFLIIEPAKGEYKHVFGNREDVTVYGTNPKKSKMLKVNPFSFPEDVHVLEHIDKLIEIFNVCWPMYAAMPAVLKDAVEKAYVGAGWDLDDSTNSHGNLFPTFNDVLNKLSEVINASEFSEEVKSNYAGALLTRVKSLTNGINGRIFTADEYSGQKLFDENAIVDISRVGSMETKALLMGILVMKLQEHRLNQGGRNKGLYHVTVLEEAHNLLKANASSVGASEGADLAGKSVEMLSNIIAEVRTYGEGFIIVDQAPGLLDASVIRNTNTKIILRLPDYEDRQLVGKAANLTDIQINEISKLPVGVAAIYHNDWLEPVLCHFEKYSDESDFQYEGDKDEINNCNHLLKYLVDQKTCVHEKTDAIDEVEIWIETSKISAEIKRKLLTVVRNKKEISEELCRDAICDMYDDDSAFIVASEASSIEEWNNVLVEHLEPMLRNVDEMYQRVVLKNILEKRAMKDSSFQEMNLKWINYMTHKGLL